MQNQLATLLLNFTIQTRFKLQKLKSVLNAKIKMCYDQVIIFYKKSPQFHALFKYSTGIVFGRNCFSHTAGATSITKLRVVALDHIFYVIWPENKLDGQFPASPRHFEDVEIKTSSAISFTRKLKLRSTTPINTIGNHYGAISTYARVSNYA